MTRRHAKIAGWCAAGLAAVAVFWWIINWYTGSPASYWITTVACALYLAAYLKITGWLIDRVSGDDLPPCLTLVGSRPHQAAADGRLVNVAGMCGDCRIKTGATSPLRACPVIEAQRQKAALS